MLYLGIQGVVYCVSYLVLFVWSDDYYFQFQYILILIIKSKLVTQIRNLLAFGDIWRKERKISSAAMTSKAEMRNICIKSEGYHILCNLMTKLFSV